MSLKYESSSCLRSDATHFVDNSVPRGQGLNQTVVPVLIVATCWSIAEGWYFQWGHMHGGVGSVDHEDFDQKSLGRRVAK